MPQDKLTAGYSGTPLIKKLGIKPGFRMAILNPPDDYSETLGKLPENTVVDRNLDDGNFDFIHYFTREKTQLEQQIRTLKAALKFTGMLWISWPKRASKVATDLDGNIVREIGLNAQLVDVKVCAVDPVWSGHKFVYRLKVRK